MGNNRTERNQKNYWQSYKSIVLLIPRIISLEEKRDLHNTAFVKDTLFTRRGKRKGQNI